MTDHQGLTSHQAKSLQATHGRNTLPEKRQRNVVEVYLSQFKSPLVFVLIVISIITFLLNEKSDTIVILLVVFFNSLIGTFQELKALHSLASLKKLITPKAKVYRDGTPQILSAEELVPGDIVIIEAGDRVPADGFLIEAKVMNINESQMTGEAFPVSKDTQKNASVSMGTLVTTGHGVMKVEKIGQSTSLGKISQTVVDFIGESTPLEKQLDGLIRGVLVVVLITSCFLFILGFIESIPLAELFRTVVSIGVSVIPEGLPIVITITLALGVLKMSQKKAIMRNLPSVSTLAGVDVICTDKTGTLTEGNIQLKDTWSFTHGKFSQSNEAEILRLSVLCNDAKAETNDIGDLLDIALLNAAREDKLDIVKVRQNAPRIGELPFDNKLRWQATLHQQVGHRELIVKGAPDALLSRCTKLSDLHIRAVEQKVIELSDQGLRVLAIAKKTGKNLQLYHSKDVAELEFVGLLVFSDTIRKDASSAIEKCHAAGIQVIMITGDHLNTAKNIAQQVGLFSTGAIAVEAAKLKSIFSKGKYPAELSVVARATPFDKSELIDQLKSEHKLVAMTGDGVNDAPALVKADIGIAMGRSGTDAAREASDMVLVDDAFSTIVDGISSARGIFENIRKVISYLFTTSFGELGVIFLALFLVLPLPLLPAQILWLNLITDGFLDISISTEKTTKSIMNRSHLRYKGKIIDKLLMLRILLLGTIMSVGTIIIFIIELERNGLPYARTAALIVLAIFQWVHAFNSRSETRSIFKMGFFTNKAVVVAVVIEACLLTLAVYNPFFQSLLKTVPVAANVWVFAVVSSLSVLVVEEIRKYLFQRFNWKQYFTII